MGISLLLSTYRAGKLLVVRPDGDVLNTLCRDFDSLMGLAYRDGELVLGTRNHVWTYARNASALAALQPPDRYDACFLPRKAMVTGNILVHELAWAGSQTWIANTRFSCLCTLDDRHSFVPRWRPSFISDLAAEDRCHLNGLGVRDDAPRYVTCFGQTDTSYGWRENKAAGGFRL